MFDFLIVCAFVGCHQMSRRNTHSKSTISIEPDPEEEPEDDSEDNAPPQHEDSTQRATGRSDRKKMTYAEEDTLLEIFLKYYDDIENKTTDKSLDPNILSKKRATAWDAIREEFVVKTRVCI